MKILNIYNNSSIDERVLSICRTLTIYNDNHDFLIILILSLTHLQELVSSLGWVGVVVCDRTVVRERSGLPGFNSSMPRTVLYLRVDRRERVFGFVPGFKSSVR